MPSWGERQRFAWGLVFTRCSRHKSECSSFNRPNAFTSPLQLNPSPINSPNLSPRLATSKIAIAATPLHCQMSFSWKFLLTSEVTSNAPSTVWFLIAQWTNVSVSIWWWNDRDGQSDMVMGLMAARNWISMRLFPWVNEFSLYHRFQLKEDKSYYPEFQSVPCIDSLEAIDSDGFIVIRMPFFVCHSG